MVIEFGTAAPPPKSPVVWDGGYNTTSLGLQQKAYNNNNNTLTSITDPTHNTPAAAAMATTASAFGYENFFFSMKDPVRLVYSLVDGTVGVCGVSLNALLLFLILTKTDQAMRVYSRLLLMSGLIDLIVSFWTFLVQPIPCIDHGYKIIFLNGVFRNAAQPIRYASYLIWIQLMLFFLITTLSQYVYRYCIFCRNGVIPKAIFWLLMFVNILLNAFHGLVMAWADFPRSIDAVKMAEIHGLITAEAGITDLGIIAFVKSNDLRWMIHNGIMVVIIPIFYAVIVICYVKIRASINAMQVPKVREYNRNVSAALLFQAILPTFDVCVWTIEMLVGLIWPNDVTVFRAMFPDIIIHMVPMINPIGTIYLIRPYRRATRKLFAPLGGACRGGRVGVSSQQQETGGGGGGTNNNKQRHQLQQQQSGTLVFSQQQQQLASMELQQQYAAAPTTMTHDFAS